MKLKAGYKMTEVGVIPEDWRCDYIENFAVITTGQKNTQDRIEEGKYPFFVRSQTVERINSYSFDGEAVLTAGDGVGTGKVFHYIKGKFDVHQRVYQICNFAGHISGYYFYLYFGSHFYNRIVQMNAKSSVDSVRREMISRMQVALPSTKKEQDAIVKAISDVDSLLEGLEKLIEKKRNIKQATMQQLLTGKTRLPGFTGEWSVVALREVLTICHGKNQHAVEIEDGPIPILATGGQIGYASNALYEKPSVLIGRKGTINKPQYIDKPFWTIDTLFYSVIKHGNHAKFFYYRFLLIDWLLYNESSGVPSLSSKTIESIEIKIPKLKEQIAISNVLCTLDEEITKNEILLIKVSKLKQGMMQELLTGKTRLV